MSVVSYQYRAMDKRGATRSGTIKALSEQDAYRKLSGQGLTPVKLRAVRAKKQWLRRGASVTPRDIAHFTYQLGVLMEARIPIADGLASIAEQETNHAFKALLLDVAGSIQAGASVTDAMAEHRRVFGDVYIETVRAAEKSGNMISVLGALGEMLERQAESVKQVRGALTYPIVVVVALSAATLFLLTFVVPRFAEMFAQRGVELPALTVALQAFGLSIRDHWWLYGGGLLAGVFAVRFAWRTPKGRGVLDRWLHGIPYVRSALIGLAVGRFARIFGLCLSAGLGLLDSLDMAGRASGRPMLQKDAKLMMDQVRNGDHLADALRDCSYLPAFAKRMIAAGEQSAELNKMCGIVARHYDREVSHLVKNIATIVEPVLIASMTFVVLIVALAVFLPMWDMVSLVG